MKALLHVCSAGRNALVVLIAAVTVGICQSKGFQPFTTAGNITPGLPPFHAPAFELTYHNHTYTAKEISSVRTTGAYLF